MIRSSSQPTHPHAPLVSLLCPSPRLTWSAAASLLGGSWGASTGLLRDRLEERVLLGALSHTEDTTDCGQNLHANEPSAQGPSEGHYYCRAARIRHPSMAPFLPSSRGAPANS